MEIRASDLKLRQKGKQGTQVPSQLSHTGFSTASQVNRKKQYKSERKIKGQMGVPGLGPALSRGIRPVESPRDQSSPW